MKRLHIGMLGIVLPGIWAFGKAGYAGMASVQNMPAQPQPVAVSTRAEAMRAPIDTQMLPELDRPVNGDLDLAGRKYPTRRTEQGELEIDLSGQGSFSRIRPEQMVSISLTRESSKRTLPYQLLFRRSGETWTVRCMTQLVASFGKDEVVIVDANANGIFNEPGVDGMTWKGEKYLFPLPAPSERWCTENQVIADFTLGPWGEEAKAMAQPMATAAPAALPVLLGVNFERTKIGLTPRPEDPKLSEDLQKHCAYMKLNNKLEHGESSNAGATPEGAAAGARSILAGGRPAARIAIGMVSSYFHRQDVIRPDALGFGVGYESGYGGIDGRTALEKTYRFRWPVLCPAPGQKDVGLVYGRESPGATPGNNSAGYPITAYFGTANISLDSHRLVSHKAGKAGAPIECYEYDPQKGAGSDLSRWQRCLCIISKDPLTAQTEYEVMFKATIDGKPWEKTWRFTTGSSREGLMHK